MKNLSKKTIVCTAFSVLFLTTIPQFLAEGEWGSAFTGLALAALLALPLYKHLSAAKKSAAAQSDVKAPNVAAPSQPSAPVVEKIQPKPEAKAPSVFAEPKPSVPVVEKVQQKSEAKAPSAVAASKPSAPIMEKVQPKVEAKAPSAVTAPKHSAPVVEKIQSKPEAKAPSVVAASKPSAPIVEKTQPKTAKEKLYKNPPQLSGYTLQYSYQDVDLAVFEPVDVATLEIGYAVEIAREPDNQYDDKAVCFQFRDKKLGYLNKGKLQDMVHDFIGRGGLVFAYISSIQEDKVYFSLHYYDVNEVALAKKLAKEKPFKTLKLTGTAKQAIQENIDCIGVGDPVEFEYSAEYEKPAACVDGAEIGFISDSNYSAIEELSSYTAYVQSIDENDAGKNTVAVVVFQ